MSNWTLWRLTARPSTWRVCQGCAAAGRKARNRSAARSAVTRASGTRLNPLPVLSRRPTSSRTHMLDGCARPSVHTATTSPGIKSRERVSRTRPSRGGSVTLNPPHQPFTRQEGKRPESVRLPFAQRKASATETLRATTCVLSLFDGMPPALPPSATMSLPAVPSRARTVHSTLRRSPG